MRRLHPLGLFGGCLTISALMFAAHSVHAAPFTLGFDTLVADQGLDGVYRSRDLNGDGDAQDNGEARVWFSEENAAGLTLPTPNGISEGRNSNVYILNAGTRSSPSDGISLQADRPGRKRNN